MCEELVRWCGARVVLVADHTAIAGAEDAGVVEVGHLVLGVIGAVAFLASRFGLLLSSRARADATSLRGAVHGGRAESFARVDLGEKRGA